MVKSNHKKQALANSARCLADTSRVVVVVVSCAYNASETNRKENTRMKRIKVFTAHPQVEKVNFSIIRIRIFLITIKLKIIIAIEMLIIRIEKKRKEKKFMPINLIQPQDNNNNSNKRRRTRKYNIKNHIKK